MRDPGVFSDIPERYHRIGEAPDSLHISPDTKPGVEVFVAQQQLIKVLSVRVYLACFFFHLSDTKLSNIGEDP
jgi:hypothetical protein